MLHNLLITDKNYCPPGFADAIADDGQLIEGNWRRNVFQLTALQSSDNRGYSSSAKTNNAKTIRDKLKDYFVCPLGALPWQNKCLD